MKCYLCNNRFYIRRTILDLFKEEKEYICNYCYKKYPIKLNYEEIQLDIFKATVISIFSKKYNIDYNLYFKEYSKIFLSLFLNNKKVIFLSDIKYSYSFYEYLDCITKLENNDIIVLCFNASD